MRQLLALDLFKEISEHYEVYYKLPPLTARIYTLFIFNNCKDGLTFDELVEIFQASKSSVSTSLNVLIEHNYIEQIKKENERKRYFRSNRNLFLKRLDDVLKRLKNEKEINIKLKEYRQSTCRDLFKQEAFDVYIDHLSDVTQSIEKTIQNLKLHIKPNEE
ncbi:GbsR/MarR family transcriptional regulator [Paenimyroides aestuarii]|uniref:Transcriptional regulator n=1 Tax=Paenimyroides aestuarii TaxID=2968490 RepID=A0ABY5NVP5_9FLAO|nr:transcriptional regulator [Paenimyroides aestuarii]UUV22690.1 transcriptional regulator [Paenimyroides aestuarii]